jgi:hypothetical protein
MCYELARQHQSHIAVGGGGMNARIIIHQRDVNWLAGGRGLARKFRGNRRWR